jgi:hypothetical protein
MSKPTLVALTAALLLISSPTLPQDATTMHDLECFLSMKAPEASPDEKTRWGASAVATFYLGRLDQKGLSLEQIQYGVEMILVSPVLFRETQKQEFSGQCVHDVNDRVNALKSLAARDKGRLQNRRAVPR